MLFRCTGTFSTVSLDAKASATVGLFRAMRLDLSKTMSSAILSNPEIMGGTPCLAGTRVPFQTLLDYLEAGDSLDQFLADFPSVPRELAVAALQQAGDLALAHARVA